MYGSSSLPPQEGNDPKLSSIMPFSAQPPEVDPSAAVSSEQPIDLLPSNVSEPNIVTMKLPPQVGNDPKLLACMNDGGAAILSSSADLSAAASAPSQHQQQQQLSDAAPPSKESIANSLLSFKQTSPISTASSSGTSPPVETLTNSNHGANNVSCASVQVAAKPSINNSHFWQQEEEERFLLGLRMYGWGQWKRISSIVKTRTNTQIKSHAQKREKVNPEIKTKYGKGACRRGRISSSVLANDARVLSTNGGDLLSAIDDDQNQFPPLEQMIKDVYQTNNGDGPNSRVRRYRHTPYHRSTYRPHSTQVIHSSPSTQEESVTGTEATSVPQDPPRKEASDEMIGELDARFGLPVDAKLTWPHPLRGGTCVYAQVRDITNPDTLHWNPGTVNACVKKEDGYRYHILFDNEEEGHDLQEKSVLHRLDYDKIFKHK